VAISSSLQSPNFGYTCTTDTTHECTTHRQPSAEKERRVPPQHSGLSFHPHICITHTTWRFRPTERKDHRPSPESSCPVGKSPAFMKIFTQASVSHSTSISLPPFFPSNLERTVTAENQPIPNRPFCFFCLFLKDSTR